MQANLVRLVPLAAVAGALVLGVVLLLPTAVPGDLSLRPQVPGVVRIAAPPGQCWTATIEHRTTSGCGPEAIPVRIDPFISVGARKRDPGGWKLAVGLVASGERVRWATTSADRGAVAMGYETPPVESFFDPRRSARAERYERFLDVLWAVSTLTLLAVLALYARVGVCYVRESSAGPIGTGMLLAMLGLGVAWLVRLPFRIAAHWWDRRYGVDDVGYVPWIFADWGVLAAEFAAVCFALLVVMALARRLGEGWWLPGAATFVAVAALFSFVSPYLVFGTRPLQDEPLRYAAGGYERALRLPHIPLRVLDVGDTRDVNAFAAGIGPSRRVVLWDTLLDGRFSLGEQEVVVAHELGHHASKHILKGLAWFAVFALPGAWILMRATRSRGGMGVPEAVPLALLVVALLQLAAAPARNWISRRMEAEADWKALQLTRDPRDFQRLMVGFQETSLEDPGPPTWAYVLLADHPTLEQRVGMARSWAARESG